MAADEEDVYWQRAINAKHRLASKNRSSDISRLSDEYIVSIARIRFNNLTIEEQVTLSLIGW